MSEQIKAFVAGLVVGIILTAIGLQVPPGSAINSYHKAINKCEAPLPRDQHCVITAIPELAGDNAE